MTHLEMKWVFESFTEAIHFMYRADNLIALINELVIENVLYKYNITY